MNKYVKSLEDNYVKFTGYRHIVYDDMLLFSFAWSAQGFETAKVHVLDPPWNDPRKRGHLMR